jgi:GNAT superfamily N-acetyltransferase
MGFTIRSVSPDDWEAIRSIRLRMLGEIPLAFSDTLAHAQSLTESDWRERGRYGQDPHGASLAAIADDGVWLGVMGGLIAAGRGPMLVGVYVAPEARGPALGVADALLTRIEEWARTESDTLTLDVNENNPRAIAFYSRRGFVMTGGKYVHPVPSFGYELEMRAPV